MTIYVVCNRAGGGHGPAIGGARWDVPVEVPDRTTESFARAQAEAAKRYAERFNCRMDGVIVMGLY